MYTETLSRELLSVLITLGIFFGGWGLKWLVIQQSFKGTAKGRIVPVRFTAEDFKAVSRVAKANGSSLSEWIRSTLLAKASE